MIFVGIAVFTNVNNDYWFGSALTLIAVSFYLYILKASSRSKGSFISISDNNSGYPILWGKVYADELFLRSIYLIFIFWGLKYFLYGIPLLSNNPNIDRVYFNRTWALLSDVFLYYSYLIIVFCVILRKWKVLIYLILLESLIGLLSGFRSLSVEPVIYFLMAFYVFADNGLLKLVYRYKNALFVFVAIGVIIMLLLTWLRFGDKVQSLADLIVFSIQRIVLINYNNIQVIDVIVGNDYLWGQSYVWDFLSPFTRQLGFNGMMTKLSGYDNYQTLRMTPTIVGEGIANFGYYYWVFYVPVIIVTLLLIVHNYYYCIRRRKPMLLAIVLFLGIAFCRNSVPHGFGTFYFNLLPKVLISSVLFVLTFRFKIVFNGYRV